MADLVTRPGGAPVASTNIVSRDGSLRGDGTTERPLGVGFAPSLVPFVPPYPDTVPTITTIYARTTGSDESGTGTLANPFRTFKRAIREVPNVQSPGFAYTVDPTGLFETFPSGYQLPPFQATVQAYTFLDSSTLPFVVGAAVNIRATPRAFSGLPLADTTVPAVDIVAVAAVGPGLTSVQVAPARASWAADGAKTAMVIGDAGDAQLNCVVYGSDTTHLFLANQPSHVAVQTLSLVEPSAEFRSEGAGSDGGGFLSASAGSIAFQGIKFTIVGGGGDGASALLVSSTVQPFLELCDVDSLGGLGVSLQFLVLSSVIRSFVSMQGSAFSPRRSLILGAGFSFNAGGPNVFRQVVLDGCAPVGPTGFATDVGVIPPCAWQFLNCLIQDGTGDGVAAAGAGTYNLQDVEIDDCAGNAISAEDLVTVALQSVTGTGSTGFGLLADGGAIVPVLDTANSVTGTGGDIKCGQLAVRTWANFYGNAPVGQQVDPATLTRVFLKP